MPTLGIDIETYSEVDLPKCGVYAYAEHPSFEILLFAYAFDDEETQVVDLKGGERLPPRVLDALTDPAITKTAFNAAFERTCIGRCLGKRLDAAQCSVPPCSRRCWRCRCRWRAWAKCWASSAKSSKRAATSCATSRCPASPPRPTASARATCRNTPRRSGGGSRNTACATWRLSGRYGQSCRAIPSPRRNRNCTAWIRRSTTGASWSNPVLVARAIECDGQYREKTTKRAYELTGLANPNSPAQLKEWLEGQGTEVDTLDKKAVRALLPDAEGDVLEVLELRLLMAKTSVKKYEAIRRSVCADGRVHGLLQFYGANRTGRWAGRLVQIQNLPQNHIPDLALARDLVKAGRYADIEALYESTPNVLSELIRTAFVPRRAAASSSRTSAPSKRASSPGLRASSGGWRYSGRAGTSTVPALRRCSMCPSRSTARTATCGKRGRSPNSPSGTAARSAR